MMVSKVNYPKMSLIYLNQNIVIYPNCWGRQSWLTWSIEDCENPSWEFYHASTKIWPFHAAIVVCRPWKMGMNNMVFPKAPDLEGGNQLNLERVKVADFGMGKNQGFHQAVPMVSMASMVSTPSQCSNPSPLPPQLDPEPLIPHPTPKPKCGTACVSFFAMPTEETAQKHPGNASIAMSSSNNSNKTSTPASASASPSAFVVSVLFLSLFFLFPSFLWCLTGCHVFFLGFSMAVWFSMAVCFKFCSFACSKVSPLSPANDMFLNSLRIYPQSPSLELPFVYIEKVFLFFSPWVPLINMIFLWMFPLRPFSKLRRFPVVWWDHVVGLSGLFDR